MIVRRKLCIVAGLIVAATFQLSAEPRVPTGPFEIDLQEATDRFKKMFERTCYQHRHALGALITDRPSPEFEKVARQYPVRDEAQKSTLLAEWGVWSHGVPYKMILFQLDSSPSVTTCSIWALSVNRSDFIKSILTINRLELFREFEDNNNIYTAIANKDEPNLRIVCGTPKAKQLLYGECQVWLWRGTGS